MGLLYTCMLSVDGVQWVWFNSVVHVALVKRLSLCVYVTRSCTQVCVSWHLSLTPSVLLYCTACAAGEYASGSCLPCPANSDSEAGATICTCDEGYYRSETEGPEIGCTREFAGSNSNVMMPVIT